MPCAFAVGNVLAWENGVPKLTLIEPPVSSPRLFLRRNTQNRCLPLLQPGFPVRSLL